MKYEINDVYLKVNGERIKVGVVLGEEDKPRSPYPTEFITNTEYENGLKCFKYGRARICNLSYYQVGEFKDNVAVEPIDNKWIEELQKMGYDTTNLKYNVKE